MPTHAASLLAECAAHPDDDTPRMIWADAIGGERGELVALQCGREDLPRAELAWRNRRERELLAAHAMAWSGLERIATRVRYRRGFVDAIEVTADTWLAESAAIVELAPLVTALTVTGILSEHADSTEAIARLERVVEAPAFVQVRALDLVELVVEPESAWADAAARMLARRGALGQLAALGLPHGLTGAGASAFARAQHRLERLWLRSGALTTADLRRLAPHLPRLAELELGATQVDFSELAGTLPNLRSLILRDALPDTLGSLARSELAPGLERLVLEAGPLNHHLDDRALDMVTRFGRLRELELRGFRGLAANELATRRLPALRSLVFSCWSPTGADALVKPFAELDLLDLRGTNRLAKPPPDDLDVLADEPGEVALLDPHPRSRASWYVTATSEHPGAPTRPAWLVCEDGPEPGRVWDLGALGDRRIRIGRALVADVPVQSSMVARIHAVVMWHDGAHWIRDMRSNNGTFVDGSWIEDNVPLRDGARLSLATVRMSYFTSGASASAYARKVRTHEPLTGLPRLARTDAAWLRIANLAELERQHGQIAADRAVAEVARRLVAAAGDAELSAPQRNGFRVYPRELASHLAAACAGPFDHEGLMLDLRIEARPIG